jgi:hypothetical protein
MPTPTTAATNGLPAAQILRSTTADRIEKSQFIKLTAVKSGTSKKSGNRKLIAQSVSVDKAAPDRTKYTSTMEFLPGKRLKLSCSCSDFMFRWEFALFTRGAADIIYGNGDPPADKNPNLKPGCCKHLVAVLSKAQEKGLV